MNIKPEARKIEADFSKARIDWIPTDPELAQFWNAISIGLPLLEGYLIRSMAKVRKQLPENRADLIADCELFCHQEANHSKIHMKFNEMVGASGHYPRLGEHIDRLRSDYEQFDKERDLRYALLYSEGFETAGPILAAYFLREANKRVKEEGVDLITLSLWRWHLSEEFEHRCCAFNVVEAMYGTYWGRVRGVLKATHHLLTFAISTSEYMLGEDIKAGRVEAGFSGFRRKLKSYSGMFLFITPRLINSLSPWYNPKNLEPPEGCESVLRIASETLSLNAMASRAFETVRQ